MGHFIQPLEYLHDGCKPPIIHRDIKTANILVNKICKRKLQILDCPETFPMKTEIMYHSTSRLTKKSDVYSFRVVLLELITDKPAIIKNDENIHVVNWVKPMLERGEISNIIDPRLQGEFDINSAWKALETAMACIPTSFNQRTEHEWCSRRIKGLFENICRQWKNFGYNRNQQVDIKPKKS
ncbi:hypothetical protein HYC85_028155 [Camellia sinensis]|uniref:Protein kinase domain-containing protein n=1 Tax=Camellia sinensis TaxID=4442 RepID=A0A7J7FYD1_CAMSI|nr:hypothetical protein HYC85_028155 [Camellia sinensis]